MKTVFGRFLPANLFRSGLPANATRVSLLRLGLEYKADTATPAHGPANACKLKMIFKNINSYFEDVMTISICWKLF